MRAHAGRTSHQAFRNKTKKRVESDTVVVQVLEYSTRVAVFVVAEACSSHTILVEEFETTEKRRIPETMSNHGRNNMDTGKPKHAGGKRVAFAVFDDEEHTNSYRGNAKKYRGTPLPMKRMDDGGGDELLSNVFPPPRFNRTASADFAGIPPHDPRTLVTFDVDGNDDMTVS